MPTGSNKHVTGFSMYKSLIATYTRVCLYLILCAVCILSCTNRQPPQQVAHTSAAVPADTAPANFYKRLSGSVAGKPVILHLTSFNGRYTAYCYYKGLETFVTLSSFGDTGHKGDIRLDELCITERLADTAFQPYWLLRIRGDSAYGMRIAGANIPPGEILLKEHYPDGSYRMELIYQSLRAAYHDESDTPFVTSTHYLLWPVNNPDTGGSAFLARRFATLAGCDDPSVDTKYDVLQCISENDKNYFSEYRKTITESGMQSDDLLRPTNNHSHDVFWDVAGNDDHLLTLEITSSEYTGGAHGNYTINYYCMDVVLGKIWALPDIMTVDSNKLKVLLDIAARRYFRTGDTAALQERLLVNEIPITGNIYLTPAGIVFCYQPYEIASYADGVIPLFISYRELKDMLHDTFRKRMRLDQASGGYII